MWSNLSDISLKATKQWKSILFIYLVQLFLGAIVAMKAYQEFDDAIGSSLELDRLAKGFDRSVFSDMINDFPTLINQIQSRFGVLVILFLILSVFLHTGLVGNIRKSEFSIFSFYQNIKKYCVRFLGVILISLVKTIVVLAIIWVPFFMLLGNPLETFHSEKTLILTIVGLVILSVLLVIIIWLWSMLSRYQIVDGKSFVEAMKSGWKALRAKFGHYYMIGVGLILFHLILTWLYILVVDDWGAETWFCVLGLILVQQAFSLIRVWIRVFGYAAIDDQTLIP